MVPPQPAAPSRLELLAVCTLVGLGVALRVAYTLALRAHPTFEAPVMDPGYHWAWAKALAAGAEFQDGPFFRAPLYPLWLALWVTLFGEGTTLYARLAQAALGGLSIALTWTLGRRIGALAGGPKAGAQAGSTAGPIVGLSAAALVAVAWSLIAFDAELQLPTLDLPLLLAGLVLSARALEVPTRGRAVLAGLAFGLAAITRPNVLLCLPVPWLLLWRRAGKLPALALAVGVLIPIAPVSLHNALEGDVALISTQGGVNLWIGNNPASDGTTAIVPGTRGGWWEGYHDAIAAAEAAEGRPLRATEVSEHYTRRAFAYWRSEPLDALGLLAWKLRLFVADAELGNNTDPRFVALRFAPWLAASPVRFGWLAALGLVGLTLAARCGTVGRLTAGFVLLYVVSVVLFFVNSRFRLPVLPALAIGAVFFVVRVRALGRAGWPAVVAALALGILAHWPIGLAREGAANGLLDLAKGELARGKTMAASKLLEEALERDPGNVFARVAWASALQALGEAPRAVALMEETLRSPLGAWPEVRAQLVDALVDAGRAADARKYAEEGLDAAPRQPALRYGLARALGALGDAQGARAALRQVLTDDPSAAHAALALGELERALGDEAAARRAFERVVQLEGRVGAGLVALARARLAERAQ